MNSYSVRVTDQDFNPIDSTLTYSDINGVTTGTEVIPAGVHTLNPTLMENPDAFGMTFTAPGYYDFDIDKFHLPDSFDITLQRKPNHGIEVVAGAAIIAILAFFYK
jgi:hypothetical protein